MKESPSGTESDPGDTGDDGTVAPPKSHAVPRSRRWGVTTYTARHARGRGRTNRLKLDLSNNAVPQKAVDNPVDNIVDKSDSPKVQKDSDSF